MRYSDDIWKKATAGVCPFCNLTNTQWVTDSSDNTQTEYLWCKNCEGAPMACHNDITLVRSYEATAITICPRCGEETASGSDGLQHLLVLGSIYN